jgi:aspartate ammonia-lyase
VNQVCFDIIGGDVTVTMAAEGGQLQLNVFEPIIAFRLLRHISALATPRGSCASAAWRGSRRIPR